VKDTLLQNVKLIQALGTLMAGVAFVVIYIHSSFATNDRVNKLEAVVIANQEKASENKKTNDVKIVLVQNILCRMAIEQKLSGAIEICANNEPN